MDRRRLVLPRPGAPSRVGGSRFPSPARPARGRRQRGDPVDTVRVTEDLRALYDHLRGRGGFVALDRYELDHLPILSRDVLRRIPTEDTPGEAMVPAVVVELIRERGFFGKRKDR